MSTFIFICLMVALVLLVFFVIVPWRIKRASRQVVQIFRKQNAIAPGTAKSIDDLGLESRGMLESIFKGRNYKQYALDALVKAQIIQLTEDKRLYLSEGHLKATSLNLDK